MSHKRNRIVEAAVVNWTRLITTLGFESRLMIAAAVFAGIPAIFLVPPLSTFDAPSHFYRIDEISRGELRSRHYSPLGYGSSLPNAHIKFVDALWDAYWGRHDFLSLSAWAKISRDVQDDSKRTHVEFTNTAVYSPVNYFAPALGMAVARAFTPSALTAHRVASFANLTLYTALVVLALQLLPRLRRGILLLATSPFLFIQATTLSTDAINFAMPLLLIAAVWRLRANADARPAIAVTAILLLGLLIALLKPVLMPCLLCLWLIPASCFRSPAIKFAFLAGHLALAVGIWTWWNRPYLGLDIAHSLNPADLHTVDFADYTLANPGQFLAILYTTLLPKLWHEWMFFYGSVGGWISSDVHSFVLHLSRPFLVMLLFCESRSTHSDWRWMGGIAVQSLSVLGLTLVALWCALGYPGIGYLPVLGRYLAIVYAGFWILWAEGTPPFLASIRKYFFAGGLLCNAIGYGSILADISWRIL